MENCYFNRDLSWLDFNERVLEEGLRKDLPLFERFRFLTIVTSNFDEFFMVRVAAIKRLLRTGLSDDPSGLNPAQLLKKISKKVKLINQKTCEYLDTVIFPDFAAAGIVLTNPNSYTESQRKFLESWFTGQVYPVLTPMRIEDDKPLPYFDSRCINAAFLLTPQDEKAGTGEKIVMMQIPKSIDRIIWIPSDNDLLYFALLEDIVLEWGAYFFPGYNVQQKLLFKINRDADFSVDERRDEDFVEAMGEVLEGREKSEPVRMVHSPASGTLRDVLAKRFLLEKDDLYEYSGPFNLSNLLSLTKIEGLEYFEEKAWKIHPAPGFTEEESIWEKISQGDIALHVPYQSFKPVIRFFQEAAEDPQVISIKTTLYRTSGSAGNPIVRALEQAALNGKHVTALVELKARFDEERNISWAARLEKAGVIVVYGLSGLKVHAKITMVLRREHDRIKRYVHLSTGNYNEKTAKSYEDICLFTCRDDIAYDAGLLFNMLTGYSLRQSMFRLIVAPYALKSKLLELIEREAKRSDQKYPGKIMIKCNALTDTDIINAMYDASRAGVKISLCIRGICSLVPGIPNLSENIRVISIIDHYLEHSRIYYFSNGGSDELYLSSSDMMPRNLNRRVEIMFPVQDDKLRSELLDKLSVYFMDNSRARKLDSQGDWKQLAVPQGEAEFRVQKEMLSRAAKESEGPGPVRQEFIVRRS